MIRRILSVLATLFLGALLAGCGGDSPTRPDDGPTGQELVESADDQARVTREAADQSDQAIEEETRGGGSVDVRALADQTSEIQGVADVTPSDNGTSIAVRLSNGAFTNVLLNRRDDPRIFGENGSNREVAVRIPDAGSHSSASVLADRFPEGDRAVILAPFQADFQQDLSDLRQPLEAVGFEVDVFTGGQANLDRFRGSFLQQYDVIYISTHGAAGGMTTDGRRTTMLLTGETTSESRHTELGAEALADLGVGGVAGHNASYYAVTAQWLRATASDFGEAYVFADACESSHDDSGSGSLSATLHDLGAGGFSGWDETINVGLANPAAEKLVVNLTAGDRLTQAGQDVRSDLGLQALAFVIRVRLPDADEPTARIGLLDETTRTSEDFFLFDPDRLVGTAELEPSSGPPGTPVTFIVRIRDDLVGQVSRVEVDIDNTDEHLAVPRVGTGVYRRADLTAPLADDYPRVDTFTFTAFAADGSVVGRGSATFTITEPEGSGDVGASLYRTAR